MSSVSSPVVSESAQSSPKAETETESLDSTTSHNSHDSTSSKVDRDVELVKQALDSANQVKVLVGQRKVPKCMRYINVMLEMLLIAFAFANVIVTVISEQNDSKGFDLYFKISSIALPAIPVFWSKIMDSSKQFTTIDEIDKDEELNDIQEKGKA